MQTTVQEAFALAARHEADGRSADARAIYEQILAAAPEHPGALLRIAQQDLAAGEFDAAQALLARALAGAHAQALPAHEIWLVIGRAQLARQQCDAAIAAVEQAMLSPPHLAASGTRLGQLALDAAGPATAERCFRAALESDPESAGATRGLALALSAQRKGSEALAAARRGIELLPDAVVGWRVLALVALDGASLDVAEHAARQGLERHPQDIALRHTLGKTLKAAGALDAARATLEQCTALAPDDAAVLNTLGATCLELNDPAEARRHFDRAIELGDEAGELLDNLGLACRAMGDEEGAVAAFGRALRAAPALTPAMANLVYAQQYLCSWDALEESERRLVATLSDPDADPRWPPFVALAMALEPSQQLEVARRWSRAMLPAPAARRRPTRRAGRLRIGYLSGNFHEHPTARLMVGLFEEHDRARFEVTGYSYGPDDGSALRTRVRHAFEHWRDVRSMSDDDIARTIRGDGIDLLIERKGHTYGGRLGILGSRPAPIQIHYMSFPGTLGYDAVDGVIADAEVVPPGADADFHERVWRLPRCYYVNDKRRGVPSASSRRDNGLPDGALVLACLNQSYKLRRPFFAAWMDVLRAHSNAVLWLLAGHPRAQANLRTEAVRHGVDPARLIFARGASQDVHVGRVACADLALDTLPYGAHTTGVDALWAGVPMLTCRGNTFAGRVGASLLLEAGLADLVTNSLDEYRARLIELAADRSALREYRSCLESGRDTNRLFDTAGFTRNWEALLLAIYDEAAGP
ncbi:MAG TPA: tetratricopeptide repeat protein [Casimicrobiaceae bacterium]|jgi:predicted O-linked N-acetylglucosamine transferase (SPINDLY family)